MAALKAAPRIALTVDCYEVRDLLTGEVIGRISSERLQRDSGLGRALKRHGFRLVGVRDSLPEAEARLDGFFVLRTGTELPAEEVARAYKSLWRVERTFREVKSTLSVRPIYHQSDEQCVGHIVAAFLALRLEVDLQRRLEERGVEVSWPALVRDLSQVQAVHLEMDGAAWLIRTDLEGSAHAAFTAAGLRLPSRVTPLG